MQRQFRHIMGYAFCNYHMASFQKVEKQTNTIASQWKGVTVVRRGWVSEPPAPPTVGAQNPEPPQARESGGSWASALSPFAVGSPSLQALCCWDWTHHSGPSCCSRVLLGKLSLPARTEVSLGHSVTVQGFVCITALLYSEGSAEHLSPRFL